MLLKEEVSGVVNFAATKCLLSLTRLLTKRVGVRAHPLTHNLADQPAGYLPSSEAYPFTESYMCIYSVYAYLSSWVHCTLCMCGVWVC